MLDSTSIITFVVANTEGNIHESPKFYRQMYHYENDLFIQNRLYPQGNDGATNLYDKFRNIIVSEFNELLQCDGDWTSESSGSVCSEHIHSEGVHYRDYHYNSSVTMFYPQSKANVAKNHVMTVGHEGICPHCGKPYTEYNRFSHSNCQPE